MQVKLNQIRCNVVCEVFLLVTVSISRAMSLVPARLKGEICDGCRRLSVIRPSVVRSVVTSRKLSNIGPQLGLLSNAIRKLALLIPFPLFSATVNCWKQSATISDNKDNKTTSCTPL